MALEAIKPTSQVSDPMEWTEGRITRRSVDAAKAPETRDVITEPAYTGADKLELSSAREKILDLMYEIEALRREHSGSYVERLRSELSVSYATNRGFKQRWEDESEENEKLNAALRHAWEDNEKLNAALRHEKEGNEKLNAGLKSALLENDNLIELTRTLREQADGLRAILEIIANRLQRRPCPLRLPEIIDGDNGAIVTDDLAA